VSILNVENQMFEVMATAGDKRLGGGDINRVLTQHLVDVVRRTTAPVVSRGAGTGSSLGGGVDLQADGKQSVLQELRELVETAKLDLSNSSEYHLFLRDDDERGKQGKVAEEEQGVASQGSVLLDTIITRSEFELLCSPLFDRMLAPVHAALSEAGLAVGDVSDVVLVGGSTRIPRVRSMLADLFGRWPHCTIDPDQAVAVGAAIQGAIYANSWPIPVSAVEHIE
jgi:molecular chaperone DnaK (HSP70)